MMTPQEVAASTFPKAKLGGYSMAAVDVFLDKLTEDYSNLYKENAALKSKIKVLVDKMEEYHAMEDTMRSTLLTAQKMANNMISEAEEKSKVLVSEAEKKHETLIAEAEEKREAMLSGAEADARARMLELSAAMEAEEHRLTAVHEEIDFQIEQEQERLAVARRELAAFINGARVLCTRQLALIDRLGELEILPAGFRAAQEDTPDASDVNEEPDAAPQQPEAQPTVEEAAAEENADENTDTAEQPAAEQSNNEVLALVESMRSVIDSFASDGKDSARENTDAPVEVGFDNADKLFDGNDESSEQSGNGEKAMEDPFENSDDDSYDNFAGEEQDTTRVLNLNDLQFGRNYNKD